MLLGDLAAQQREAEWGIDAESKPQEQLEAQKLSTLSSKLNVSAACAAFGT
jgi:hypothetical protein